MANGSKTQMKQQRNAKKAAGSGAKSQKKSNEQAKNIICAVCKSTFLCTIRQPALEEHASNKHSKTLAECFPDYGK